jgi:hypothetical protein
LEEAVEMRFNSAFGNVQIACDFCVVAALQKQLDKLLFPGSHLP